MFTLIEQGEVYGPEPLGKIGEIDASSIER